MRRVSRAARNTAAILATALLGAVIGLLGAFQHQSETTLGDTRLPTGVLASIAALLLAQLVARDAVPRRLGPALVLLSWTLVVVALASARPEGDLAVPAGLTGEAFLYGGFTAGLVMAGGLAVRGASGAARDGR